MCPKSMILGSGIEVDSVIKCGAIANSHCKSGYFSYYRNSKGRQPVCRCCDDLKETKTYRAPGKNIWSVKSEECDKSEDDDLMQNLSALLPQYGYVTPQFLI